ncbi:11790_t:CDS:2 [Funneliformis geosporum]|uniref:11790_t:CDS:1 n=1 Tax=Funneliformis geosporum TaxID=1117311 RepID=A0A9W4SP19_9GLOM|nr:11790_t:CDS:2 [Funneliformis geosporum]
MNKREKEMRKLENEDDVETITENKTILTFKNELQSNNNKLKNYKVKENVELDHDMVVIESDSEITVRKSKGKPSKSLLRKPNPDSSQLNPILKRLKSSELSLPNVYCIEFESEGEGF